MRRISIQEWLIATVVLSQLLLASFLLSAGISYVHRRLLGTLDAGVQSRAMTVAALVRYTEDGSGDVDFDYSLLPQSIDPDHPDLFAVWAEHSGLVARSSNWPHELEISPSESRARWTLYSAGVPYRTFRVTQVPIMERAGDKILRPQTLTVLYAAPKLRLHEEVHRAGILIALATLLLLAITVKLALWGIRRGLLPLQQLASQAATVSAQNWELGVADDVHQTEELRPLTESMVQMLERLQSSFGQQREFLGNAAHELKTPVAVLKSTLQSLLQRPRSSQEYRTGVEHALEDLRRLEELLQLMLRLERAEQWARGTLRRDLEDVDLRVSCGVAVERIRALASGHNAEIHLSTNGAVVVHADPEDLQLVWSNLLDNAVRYTPEGGSVELEVSRDGGDAACVTITDHGPGIPAEDLPHIFDRFFRGDPSRTRATGGFGLGLAISKALVQAYGGSLTAESGPGQGSRMTVELPLK
jgi:signal transduction histidine kinase